MTKTAGVVVLLMAWSTSGSAQSWSSEQQELIAQVMRCNDGWSESIKHKKFDLFQTMCPETASAVYWYTMQKGP